MNKFDKNTSLFVIRDHFNNLTNYDTTLDYIEWLKIGNVGKITFTMSPMKLLKELLHYMKLEYEDDYYDFNIIEKTTTIEYTKLRKRRIEKIHTKRLLSITLIRPDNEKPYFTIRVRQKESFDLAEKIAIEIVNYIGLDCKIEY